MYYPKNSLIRIDWIMNTNLPIDCFLLNPELEIIGVFKDHVQLDFC